MLTKDNRNHADMIDYLEARVEALKKEVERLQNENLELHRERVSRLFVGMEDHPLRYAS